MQELHKIEAELTRMAERVLVANTKVTEVQAQLMSVKR